MRAALRDRIKAYIERNLRDPGLSINRIAEAIHCSKRNLHKAFSHDGTTISDHIWRLPLERCRADLLTPACDWKSITEIAFSWGFNSSAHFGKAFKETYGVPPRLYRLSGRRESSDLAIPAQHAGSEAPRPRTAASILRTADLSAQ